MSSFPLIEVAGTSYEMGRQHGEQAAPLIAQYLALIERITKLSRDVLCRNALSFEPLIRQLSPTFLEEVRGLADGADISYEEALLCQVRGEAAHNTGLGEGCTAFAVTGLGTANGSTLIGQNQDLPLEYMDVSIVLRLRPRDDRPAAVMYTFAGQLGYFGLNHAGVSNWANSLYDFAWQPGLAHYPLKRVALEQRSVNQVVDIYQSHRQCSAANTLISDGDGNILSIESRPEGIALYRGQQPGLIVHTNHYLSETYKRYETHSLPDSVARHDRMLALLRERWGKIDVEYVMQCLADHEGAPAAICRHGHRGMHTTSGHIAESQKGLLHVRRGYGCEGQWRSYSIYPEK